MESIWHCTVYYSNLITYNLTSELIYWIQLEKQMEACCVWPSRLGRKWTHGEGWGDGEATSAWPFYYKPAGRSVLEEAQQLLRRGVLPAECQCSSKYRRTPPAWLTQPLAKVSQCVCGCMCVWWGCCGWCWGPIHSGRPVVGGGDLHAIVESNHQIHSAIEYLLWEQSTRKKLHCFNRASVWWTAMCGRQQSPTS